MGNGDAGGNGSGNVGIGGTVLPQAPRLFAYSVSAMY